MKDAHQLPDNAKKVFTGVIHSVWQWEQPMYDGSTATFEAISRPDYGMAIGVMPDRTIMLAWDEQPDRKPVLTAIGGRLEEGESPQEGTAREFREETGYVANRLIPLFAYMPGWKNRYWAHCYIARDLAYEGEPTLDAGEKIELRRFTFDEFLQLGRSDSTGMGGPVRDWMLRITLLEALLDPTKRAALEEKLYG